jgi:hypothetical protein
LGVGAGISLVGKGVAKTLGVWVAVGSEGAMGVALETAWVCKSETLRVWVSETLWVWVSPGSGVAVALVHAPANIVKTETVAMSDL